VSPDVSARQCKSLEDAGWSLVKFRSGKSLWRRPEGGRLYRLKSAHKHVTGIPRRRTIGRRPRPR
jgi:hypothetical protein